MDVEAVHRGLTTALGELLPIDSIAVLEAVERHRIHWKPPEVRVALLAESHVRTDAIETAHRVDLGRFGYPDIPSSFVRLVYCLGYGESELVEPSIAKNYGTRPYWKLFWSCLNDPTEPDASSHQSLLKGHTALHQRVRNKIALLNQLKSHGIWLLDASLVALYGHGKKPQLSAIQKAIEASWTLHVQQTLLNEKPAAVIVIGKTVFDILGERLSTLGLEELAWIYQPGAYVKAATKLKDCISLYAICSHMAPGA